jgi:hypothetical protein
VVVEEVEHRVGGVDDARLACLGRPRPPMTPTGEGSQLAVGAVVAPPDQLATAKSGVDWSIVGPTSQPS